MPGVSDLTVAKRLMLFRLERSPCSVINQPPSNNLIRPLTQLSSIFMSNMLACGEMWSQRMRIDKTAVSPCRVHNSASSFGGMLWDDGMGLDTKLN